MGCIQFSLTDTELSFCRLFINVECIPGVYFIFVSTFLSSVLSNLKTVGQFFQFNKFYQLKAFGIKVFPFISSHVTFLLQVYNRAKFLCVFHTFFFFFPLQKSLLFLLQKLLSTCSHFLSAKVKLKQKGMFLVQSYQCYMVQALPASLMTWQICFNHQSLFPYLAICI